MTMIPRYIVQNKIMRAFDEPSLDGENNVCFKTNTWWSPSEIFCEYTNMVGQVVCSGWDFLETNSSYEVVKKERRINIVSYLNS